MSPRFLRAGLAAAALVTVLALTGCEAPLAKGNQVSPTEARQSVYTLLDNTIAFIGEDPAWSKRYPASEDPLQTCTVKGHQGLYFSTGQQRDWNITPEARDQLAEKLQVWLKKQGYTAWIPARNPKDPQVRVYAENGAVEGFEAYIAPSGVSIRADSWCVTGTEPPTDSSN